MFTLRDGRCTRDPRLDRIRQVDLRSLNYPASTLFTAEQYKAPRSYTWSIPIPPLDQAPTATDRNYESGGGCVGHGVAHELAARPGVVTGVDHPFAVDLYHGAQQRDPWPGGEYEGAAPLYSGTSVLAGVQEAQARGFIREYRWPMSIYELVIALGYQGPVVAGFDWTEGMMDTDAEGYIRPTGQVVGGHCVCLVGVKVVLLPGMEPGPEALDMVRSYVRVLNSWGPHWGVEGRAKLALIDVAMLWGTSDFVIPVGRRSGTAD